MPAIPKFLADVGEDGKPVFDNPALPANELRRLKGKKIWVQFWPWRKTRTTPENRYFHGVILPIIAEHTGDDKDQVKEGLKFKYLRRISPSGVEYVEHTSNLTTAEFEDFCTKIRVDASDGTLLGEPLWIPEPNENAEFFQL